MVDDLKNRGDRILKNIISGFSNSIISDEDSSAKDVVFGLLNKAGRSKDEVIQILGREIGLALAAVLAEPLEKMTESKRVRITVELVPKAKSKTKSSASKSGSRGKQKDGRSTSKS